MKKIGKSNRKIETVSNTKLNQNTISCLGPVADLENHLPGDWWRNIFNSLYLKTDGDVIDKNETTEKEVQLILEYSNLQKDSAILDLCCGQGRHCICLAEKGFENVYGLDRSRYLIRLARKRAQEKELHSVRFSEGDARKTRFPDSFFDLITIMGNSFGYFEREEENLEVLKEVYRLIKPGGMIFLDVTDGEWMRMHFEPRSWEWIDQTMLVCRERSLANDSLRLINREIIIDSNKGVITDQFYADRLYNFAELKHYLEETGFEECLLKENVLGSSDRKIFDLGLMGRRMLITAKASSKPELKRKNFFQEKKPCLVLMGDPSLPDKVKFNGQFNTEDFETIHLFKNALKKINDIEFQYLDNHKNLIQKLLKNPPLFVFNLCDEGFNNDAFLELHIPALLEMMKIPYTGAGPACLAMCYNKGLVSALAKDLSIPTPEEILIDAKNTSVAIPSEFPALVKPVFGDSSIGITQKAVVHSSAELIDYCDWVRANFQNIPILIQEYLTGNEYSVAIIGNSDNFIFLPILEVDYSKLPPDLPKILGYESKWDPSSPYFTDISYFEAKLPEEEMRVLYDTSTLLFQRLECRDYARFDFRRDAKGSIKLLEVNPNPAWCWDGKLNMMAGYAGWSYTELLQQILNAAKTRLNL